MKVSSLLLLPDASNNFRFRFGATDDFASGPDRSNQSVPSVTLLRTSLLKVPDEMSFGKKGFGHEKYKKSGKRICLQAIALFTS